MEAYNDGILDQNCQPPVALLVPTHRPTKWCVDFEPHVFSDPCPKGESSSNGSACPAFFHVKFKRPIPFKGFAFVYGDDCPERDPMIWKVTVRDTDCAKTKCIEEYWHTERFDLTGSPEMPRHSMNKWAMRQVIWTDEIHFKFGMTRENCGLMQIGKIMFFI